jgi:hypothetical protein
MQWSSALGKMGDAMESGGGLSSLIALPSKSARVFFGGVLAATVNLVV